MKQPHFLIGMIAWCAMALLASTASAQRSSLKPQSLHATLGEVIDAKVVLRDGTVLNGIFYRAQGDTLVVHTSGGL
jgi:hypothetical protein